MLIKPERKRKKGWIDGVEKNLKNLAVRDGKTKPQERYDWRKFLEKAKAHEGF
jgi:hypothetical protein